MMRWALFLGLLGLLGCGGPPGRHTPDEYTKVAQRQDVPVTTAMELFKRGASLEDWQAAFTATPDDMELYEAYAYRQLLRSVADATVEETLSRVRASRTEDPFIPFLQAYRMQLDAVSVRGDQATRLEAVAASVRDRLREAQTMDPDNAFWYYQEASFWFVKDEDANAWLALDQGNRAKTYRHPFAAPLPRTIDRLEDLPGLMGPSMAVFFQTSPRMFLTQFNAELKQISTQVTGDPVAARRLLVAGRRQLELVPYDMPSYFGAIGINKTLWEQAKAAQLSGADEVLKAIAAFEKPMKEASMATESAARQLKGQGGPAVELEFAATSIAQTVNFRESTAKSHAALLAAIDRHLPAESAEP